MDVFRKPLWCLLVCTLPHLSGFATTRYVWPDAPTPVAPFTNWATAAHTIQEAVDAALSGDTVWVTNGIYSTGGRAVYGTTTNRVLVKQGVAVQSVNGPAVTWIMGAAGAGGTNGEGAIRCAYVGTYALLSGFTLTNGHTQITGPYAQAQNGGGVWCETSGVVSNCMLTGNSAHYGGGVHGGTLNNCTLTHNSAVAGGGGAHDATLNNCALTGNSASYGGGGSHHSTLNNCTLIGNSAVYYGGGAYGRTLNHCTLSGNSAGLLGGGTSSATLSNCIVYYNTAPSDPNYVFSTFNYSCTTPLPSGPGNISDEPLLASATHLSANSPCIGKGNPLYSTGLDIDGERWLTPPAMGADQFVAGQATGPLTVAIEAVYTNVAKGFAVPFVAEIQGIVAASIWDFGDGVVVSNRPYVSHVWMAPGLYPVRLTAYNAGFPDGITATLLVHVVSQPVAYVDANSRSPAFPYANWETAAQTIQEAIDASGLPGRLVLVTNGIYATGGRAAHGTMTNRVVVSQGVVVQSVNGPGATWIVGAAGVGGTNGEGAVRCAYVGTNALLSGFTLTNGHTQITGLYAEAHNGGGVWCETSGVLSNCVLTGNSANGHGGGAYNGTLHNSRLMDNSAGSEGGGVYIGTLNNCTLTGNSAEYGGGAYHGTLNTCTLIGNSAVAGGGGACRGTLKNCTLSGNSADSGGGAFEATLNNCIVYYNSAFSGPNHFISTFNYSCTTPLPSGQGNISDEPLMASTTHLSASSPCLGKGSPFYSTGLDIDGEPWLVPPAMGADQFVASQATGPLTVTIGAAYTNVVQGFAIPFVAEIQGIVAASIWDFGDGVMATNRPYMSHAWPAPGLYPVRLTGYNAGFPDGITATVLVHVVSQPVAYVDANSRSPAFPYANWETAAQTIQEAIDASGLPGRLVLVTNGIYATGGRAVHGTMTNRVVVGQGVVVQSVNGPAVTWIVGAAGVSAADAEGAVRCAYVGTSALLSGFTLTNGHTRTTGHYREKDGGGVLCEASGVLSNCVLTGNSANWYGGGAYRGTLNNCSLTGNSAASGGGGSQATFNNCTLTGNSANSGGGVSMGTLNNCTLTRNSALYNGGGAFEATLNNCIVYYNAALSGPNYRDSAFNYSCTTPLPPGPGNINQEPRFVNTNAWSNLRLQPHSPCINAGTNLYHFGDTDLDGFPRIVGGKVDMGAYEFPGAGLDEFLAWLQQFGLPLEDAAIFADPDADGLHNWAEWRSGTDPTNASSVLRLLRLELEGPAARLWWTGLSSRKYRLDWSTNLGATSFFHPLATNLPGQSGTMTYTDTNAPGASPRFYRLGVE